MIDDNTLEMAKIGLDWVRLAYRDAMTTKRRVYPDDLMDNGEIYYGRRITQHNQKGGIILTVCKFYVFYSSTQSCMEVWVKSNGEMSTRYFRDRRDWYGQHSWKDTSAMPVETAEALIQVIVSLCCERTDAEYEKISSIDWERLKKSNI